MTIPVEEDISSLSAILMDEDYYTITKANTKIIEGLRIATEPLLICLKIKASLDLTKRKEEGEQIDSRDIKKHRNDVFRLSVTLTGQEKMKIPETVDEDLNMFYEILAKDPPEIQSLLKNLGITTAIAIDDIIEVLRSIFIPA